MNKLLVLSGVPGSGKSYFSNALKKVCVSHVYIVSSDALRNVIGGNQQDLSNEEVVWKMFYELAKVYSYDRNGIVILDATHFNRERRINNVTPLKQYFDEINLIVFDTDRSLVMNQNLQREFPIPPSVLEQYISAFEFPNEVDETFFDNIITIKNNEIANAIEIVRRLDSGYNQLNE